VQILAHILCSLPGISKDVRKWPEDALPARVAISRKESILALLTVLIVGVALFAYAYGNNQTGGRAGHELSGPAAVNPGKVSPRGTAGPCEYYHEAGPVYTFATNCTLGLLVDRFGPPDKVGSYQYSVHEPKWDTEYLYLSKGFRCRTDFVYNVVPEQDMKVRSCESFAPTTWEAYEDKSLSDWDGSRK